MRGTIAITQSGVTVAGCNRVASVLLAQPASTSDAAVILVGTGHGPDSVFGTRIANLGFATAPKANGRTAVEVLGYSAETTVENCRIDNFGRGVYIHGDWTQNPIADTIVNTVEHVAIAVRAPRLSVACRLVALHSPSQRPGAHAFCG